MMLWRRRHRLQRPLRGSWPLGIMGSLQHITTQQLFKQESSSGADPAIETLKTLPYLQFYIP